MRAHADGDVRMDEEAAPQFDEHLRRALADAAKSPILLVVSDFDGTLSPIVEHPELARGDAGAIEALTELSRLRSTYAAVLSGRALEDLRGRVESEPQIKLIGSHGGERDGHRKAGGPEMERIAEQLRSIAAQFPGALLEFKPASIAAHYRHVEPSSVEAFLTLIKALASDYPGLRLVPGTFVVEAILHDQHKGLALEWARSWCAAGSIVFLGDDVTDEDAFRVLGKDDVGIKVGEGETAARHRVPGQASVVRVLKTLAEARRQALEGSPLIQIDHHAVLSDQRTLALVAPGANIAWMCVPRVDSTAVFASILGGPAAGEFSIHPERWDGDAQLDFVDDSFIARSTMGSITVTDYLDCGGGRPFQRAGRSDLIRVIEGAGRALIRFAPRVDFGRTATRLRLHPGGVEVQGLPDPMVLYAPGVSWKLHDEGKHQSVTAMIDLDEGPQILELRVGASGLREPLVPEEARRETTLNFWASWAKTLRLPERHSDVMKRSALVIKALCHGPTGAICAAATTSLPEQLGGVRNWDYRFCWIRDAAWSAAALVRLNSTGHAMKYLDWLLNVVERLDSPERLKPLYTVSGANLGIEAEISEMTGYARSRPVRVGNAASGQVQLDVFGTVAELIALLAERGAPLTPDHFRLLDLMVLAVARRWEEPDHGIWEIRGAPQHHVSAKTLCWYAVDRAIAARNLVHAEQRESDLALRERIRQDILSNGYDESVGAFTAAYGVHDLDAASLMVGLTGLLPPEDPRFRSTVEQVMRQLRRGAVVYRYLCDDGLQGVEGGFHICTGWLVESLVLIGRLEEAEELFDSFVALVGPLGLMAEGHEPEHDIPLGNYPQAYSHLALINAALRLDAARKPTGKR